MTAIETKESALQKLRDGRTKIQEALKKNEAIKTHMEEILKRAEEATQRTKDLVQRAEETRNTNVTQLNSALEQINQMEKIIKGE